MANLDTRFRTGFAKGVTTITDPNDITGIAFSIVRLAAGEHLDFCSSMELALLLITGELEITLGEKSYQSKRSNVFDDSPFALHIPCEVAFTVRAISPCECAVFETKNSTIFPIKVYHPEDTPNESRGLGLVGNTALRHVRTIFDGSKTSIDAKLVLGEVINFPGRWSSYPPHHHPQPEIYHYRFTDTRGYGHAELGDDVYKVRQYDTLKILDNKSHSQCSAPGYGMYYLWVIRHLDNARYTVPIFEEEHSWTMDPAAPYWMPKEDL